MPSHSHGIFVFLPILFSFLSTSTALLCFECHANSTEEGKYCDIDSVCSGAACVWSVSSDGSWWAGCSDAASGDQLECQDSEEGGATTRTECVCSDQLCNSIDAIANATTADGESHVPAHVPRQLNVSCFECGEVSVGAESVSLPCDGSRTCRGHYCVTRVGAHPHSYCGTVWAGAPPQTACVKKPGEIEVCVCAGTMCNVIQPPDLHEPAIASNAVTNATDSPTTLAALTTAAVASPPSVPDVLPSAGGDIVPIAVKTPCRNGAGLSPNENAVKMGQKLKNLLVGGGDTAPAMDNAIQAHMCEGGTTPTA